MPEGFTRRSPYERELQPVAIVSVDPVSRTAIGVTRTRHSININCAYATGDTITIPASGEQWYCERFDMEWRLYGRIPFNDPTLNIKPEEGQVSVGSASGPLELNGTEVRANSFLRLGTAYFRDSGIALERSTDKINWEPIVTAAAGLSGLVPLIAKALTGFDGDDQTLALLSLENWAEILGTIIENFSAFWNEICQNVFVNGLKRMGFGETDLSKIVDGFQNFIDYLFSVIFCDFDGNLTPQTVLARIRDLLAPIIDNPFVQGLQAIADILGVAVGNLLNDAVAGMTTLVELIFNIITCNWDALAAQLTEIFEIIDLVDGDSPFGPANIIKSLFNLFQFLGSPEIDGVPNPVGIFFTGLSSFFLALTGGEGAGNLLQDAIQGGVGFVQLIFRIITCDPGVLDELAALVGAAEPGTGDPLGILAILNGLVTAVIENPLVVMVQNFLTALFPDLMDGTLIQQLLDGASNLVHLLIKVVTSILPFRELWETLLPFVDWAKVDEMEFVLPDLTGFFLNGITDLWKMIFKPIDLIIQGIIPAAGDTAFTDFIENLINFFSGNGLLSSFFGDPGAFDLQTLATEFMQNVLGLLTLDENGLLKIVTDFVPTVVGDFLANLLAVFGVDFNASDFNSATALATVVGTIAQGIFGQAAATVQMIFDRLVGLFGGSSVFTGGTFDITAIATYFTNNVLNLASSALQALVQGAGSLVYQIAQGIITAIRGFPFGLGVGIADTLQALLNGFVNFGRGTVKSGSNLLADPGAEVAAFWTQADATRDTTIKRSAGASLRVTSGGATKKEFWFNVDDLGSVASIDTDTGEVNYAECYVLYPSTTGGTNAGTSGTVTLVAKYYDSTGSVATTPELTATASMNKNNTTWVKLFGNFTTPTTGVPDTNYDRVDFGFRLVGGQTTSGARFYVDDMLVREISEAAATNTNLYGTASRPGTNTQVREAAIPTLSQGKVDGLPGVTSTVGTLNTTVTGTGGLSTQVGTLNGQVSGSGGLIPKLYGGSTVGNQIQVTALPTKLQSVGSGVTLQRTTSNPNPYTTLKVANTMMPWGFYDTNYTSSDFSILNVSGTTMVRASNAGWYQVEMAFGLTRAFSNYAWYFNTILFKNSQPVKYGNGVANIPLTTAIGSVYASYVPEVVQSSFIVYLEANEYLAPAYGWRPESGSPNSDTIIIANAPSGSTACITYFSVSLLNRSLA